MNEHVQSYCFDNRNLLLCRSRWRRRRRCLSSLLLWSRNFATMVTWRHTCPLYWLETESKQTTFYRAIFAWPWNENRRTKEKQQTNGKRAIWLVYRTDANARGFWLVIYGQANARVKNCHAWELSGNQPILRFDVMLQHEWSIEQYLLHIRVFFGGKTKSPCFDLFIHWLIKQITNTYWNHFSRSYENRSVLP